MRSSDRSKPEPEDPRSVKDDMQIGLVIGVSVAVAVGVVFAPVALPVALATMGILGTIGAVAVALLVIPIVFSVIAGAVGALARHVIRKENKTDEEQALLPIKILKEKKSSPKNDIVDVITQRTPVTLPKPKASQRFFDVEDISRCESTIHAYHSNKSGFSHTRYGRANHIEDLIRRSKNKKDKNKLIAQLYLHHQSIADPESALLRCIEKCLIILLNINLKIIQQCKNANEVSETIKKAVTLANQESKNTLLGSIEHYEERLLKLKELDKKETAWFTNSFVNQGEFDTALIEVDWINRSSLKKK